MREVGFGTPNGTEYEMKTLQTLWFLFGVAAGPFLSSVSAQSPAFVGDLPDVHVAQPKDTRRPLTHVSEAEAPTEGLQDAIVSEVLPGTGLASQHPGCISTCDCEPTHRRRFHPLKNLWYLDKDYYRFGDPTPPFGSSVNYFVEAQKANGRRQQYVFYSYHFGPVGSPRQAMLTTSGVRHAAEIVRLWPLTPATIWVRPTGFSGLDMKRLETVLKELEDRDLSLESSFVGLGGDAPAGMTGDELRIIQSQRLMGSPFDSRSGSRTTSGGVSASAGAGQQRQPVDR